MPETPKSFEERGDGKRNVPSVTTYGLPPQTAAVPARQDAVPDNRKAIASALIYLRDNTEYEARAYVEVLSVRLGFGHAREIETAVSTLPTQTAVGEGELPKLSTAAQRQRELGWYGESLKERETQLHEAIAQRDEANRKPNWGMQAMSMFAEMYEGCGVTEYWREKLADMLGINYGPNLAALDVPKPESEEIERLKFADTEGMHYRVGYNRAIDEVLSRLRSLPSEPGSGVQRKAVENAS